MARVAIVCITFALMLSAVPNVAAHDEPPVAAGMILALSGSGGDFDLIRETPAEASQGSRDIVGGVDVDLGVWLSAPLENDLSIVSGDIMVVMWALPLVPVIGDGIEFTITVSIDGEVIDSHTSDVVSMIEPLIWTAVPWFAPNIEFNASAGQQFELHAGAMLDGVGSARVQWGNEMDSPATFSIENWLLVREESQVPTEESSQLEAKFNTPWNCSDIDAVTLETKGPVDDHDMAWEDGGESETRALTREECTFALDLAQIEGTHLTLWKVSMSDGGIINQSGNFEVMALEPEGVTQPLHVNLLGGVMGALLAGVLLVAEVSRKVYPERFEGQESLGYFERLQSGFSAEQLAVIGIAVLVGALTNLTVTIMLFAVLYASLWSIND
jgi:hypothetical protein